MDIMDLVSKGIIKITKGYGKKYAKNHDTPAIEDVMPVEIKGSQFNVGFSRDEIMPDTSTDKIYWIAGHGSGHKMEGIKTPVYASAVWIDCGNNEGILWIGADIVGFTGVEVNKVRGMLADFAKETGCKCINISSTHSHSGIDTVGYWGKPFASVPADGKDPEYIAMLMDKMVKVSKEAYANRKPGKLYAGNKEIEESLANRRAPKKKPFKKVTRIRFAPEDGSNETWILNFPAHPNSLGGSNRMLSAEYPYYLREKVKADCGADVLYSIGAIGAVDAPEFGEDVKGFDLIKMQGELIADAAMAIDNDVELTPDIKFVQQPFYYPISNNVLTLLAMRHTFNANVFPCDIGEMGLALRSELTYMNIGGKKLVTFPGEMFQQTVYGGYDSAEESATGKGPEINPTPISEIAGDPDLLVFGVTNDMTGYVVPPNDFVLHETQPYLNKAYDRNNHDHYHETNSMGFESQKIIADTFTKVAARLDK